VTHNEATDIMRDFIARNQDRVEPVAVWAHWQPDPLDVVA
jgi:hypothetical protein